MPGSAAALSQVAPGSHVRNVTTWRSFNWLCIIIVLVLLEVRMWNHRGPHKATTLPVPAGMGDFDVNTKASAKLCRDPDHHYWRDFVYPPPAVLLWQAFEKLGYPAGAVAWLALLSSALAGCLLVATGITGKGPVRQAVLDPPSGLILALAFAATEYYCIWDLSVVNVNSIYLFLVLGGLWAWLSNRRGFAGVLLAASVALKIYSIIFLPFLLFRREWRMACAMLVSLGFFFLVVPSTYFGVAEGMAITQNWLQTVAAASGPDYLLDYTGFKISLSWIVMLLLDPRASGGKLNVLNCSPELVLWLMRAIYACWMLLVAVYFATSRRESLDTSRGRIAFALDVSVLLMFPLPLSPFLQPPHPLVLVVPAIALLRYAFESPRPLAKRWLAAFVVASGCFVELTPNPWRGLGAMLTIALFFAGIWMVRRDLADSDAQAPDLVFNSQAPAAALDGKSSF